MNNSSNASPTFPIDEDTLHTVLSLINPITRFIDTDTKAKLTDAMATIDPLDRDEVLKCVPALISKSMPDALKIHMIKITALLPRTQRDYLIQFALQLRDKIGPSMRAETIIGFQIPETMQKVAEIFSSEREKAKNLEQHPGISSTDLEKRIQEKTQDRMKRLISIATTLIDSGMSLENKFKTIEGLAHIPFEQRQFVENLIRHTNPAGKVKFLESIDKVPLLDKDNVLRCAHSLAFFPLGQCVIDSILDLVIRTPQSQRNTLVAFLSQLCDHHIPNGALVSETKRLITFMSGLSDAKKETTIRHLCTLLQPTHLASNGAQFIAILSNVPEHKRERIVTLVNRLPLNDLEKRLREIIRLDKFPNHAEAEFIMHGGNNIPPLENQGNPAPMQVPRAQQNAIPLPSANVHAGERDEETKEAIQKLYKSQAGLKQREIERAKDAFIKYLDETKIKNEDKQLARKALLTPREEARKEPFGPLIDSTGFSLIGFPVLGAELIGRLWIFASQLADEKDQENAKLSMITALRDSYEGRDRICNQGKAQHLVVAVLQGRFDGVNIDSNQITSIATLVNLFFASTKRQEIVQLEELVAEVLQFVKENNLSPKDKEAFFKQLSGYAEESEIAQKDVFLAKLYNSSQASSAGK